MAVCGTCKSLVQEGEARFCPHCGKTIAKLVDRVAPGSEIPLGDWGRVVVSSVVGEGGMGIVYRGWLYYDPAGRYSGQPTHPVAVKALHPLIRGRPRARELFLREAEALKRLAHPNIVHFFGLVESDGPLALVMEFVDGQPLHSLLEAHRAAARPGGIPCMPFALAWHYFAQLLGSLAAVHTLGILHRDVKPANVLVRTDGVIKLTDFGIARIPSDEAQTSGGMAVGTGAYMSPEQVMGTDLDPRADLYAAAIVLYEALAGRTPFDRPERNELMVRAAQLDEVAQPITQIVPGAPAVLDTLFARALAKDRTHRYGSAIELGEAFRTAMGLPEHDGWLAEQRLAKSASALSAHHLEPSAEPAISPERAAELRTGVMRAFQG